MVQIKAVTYFSEEAQCFRMKKVSQRTLSGPQDKGSRHCRSEGKLPGNDLKSSAHRPFPRPNSPRQAADPQSNANSEDANNYLRESSATGVVHSQIDG